MASLQLTNSEVNRAVAMVLGIDRDSDNWTTIEQDDTRAVIRAGLRKFFNPITPDGSVHQWRFLERQFTAGSEATYETGTITVVDGVVTGAGTTFPSWAADGIMRIGSETYYVDTRDSDTQLTLFQTSLDAAALTTYELHRWRYPMPADFSEFIDGLVYSNGSTSQLLQNSNEHEIRLRQATTFLTGNTQMFALYYGNVAANLTTQRWYLSVWPIFDQGAFITGTYRAMPTDLLNADITADGTVVQVDAVHAETLLAAIMAAAEEYMNDETGGSHAQRYRARLTASINHDRNSKGPVSFSVPKGGNPRAIALLNHTPTYNDLLS